MQQLDPYPRPQQTQGPPVIKLRKPYFVPNYCAFPHFIIGPPMDVVDKFLPTIPFSKRPKALSLTIILMIIIVILCLIIEIMTMKYWIADQYTGGFIITLVLSIILMSTASIWFLLIPRKAGWYFAFATSYLTVGILIVISIITAYLPIAGGFSF